MDFKRLKTLDLYYYTSLLLWIILRGIQNRPSLSYEIYFRFHYEKDTAVAIDSRVTEVKLDV